MKDKCIKCQCEMKDIYEWDVDLQEAFSDEKYYCDNNECEFYKLIKMQ